MADSTETQGDRQIVVNDVPNRLVEDIDALAAADQRSRAFTVRELLKEIVAQKKAAAAASKKEAVPA
jgi:hypothetical protein